MGFPDPATIEIMGSLYGLLTLPDGFDLCKHDGTSYRVQRGEGGPSCECPDFRFRHAGLPTHGCRHVRALRAVGLLPPLSPATLSPAFSPAALSPVAGPAMDPDTLMAFQAFGLAL